MIGTQRLNMRDERPASFDALLADPAALSRVSLEQAAALLGRLATVQALLTERAALGRIVAGAEQPLSPAPGPAAPAPAWSEADLLTVDEVAAMLRVPKGWVYRHAKTLPFTRKLSPKKLRFSRAGLLRWLASRRT